ncbi:MAG: response regulator transcription factor [Abditibacteriota bacterium]|nr:response regulator transcription factor [Abditibacteriota bacterium]
MENIKILIADDDPDLIEGLGWYLENENYKVISAADGEEALARFRSEKPTLAILDVMMPKKDGIEVCGAIAAEDPNCLIMMLSARDGEIDKVRALKGGADDYVTKPFKIAELVARIGALLRRRSRSAPQAEPETGLRYQNLVLNKEERMVRVEGKEVELTVMEFDMLLALMERPGKPMARGDLAEIVWGNFYGDFRQVDNLIFRLREKLSAAGCENFPIATVRGIGYAFRP